MKFKTKEDLDRYINEKRAKQYVTTLTTPLSLEEIDILRTKPLNIPLGRFYEIQTKSEDRITSVLRLLYEIEGFDFGGWNYREDDGENELCFLSDTSFYIYTYDSDTLINDVFENELPVGYLFLEKHMLIKCFLDDVYFHYANIIEQREM